MNATVIGCKEATSHECDGWEIGTETSVIFMTREGGHIAPVTFLKDTDLPVQPYYINPWHKNAPAEFPDPLLKPLRGDFFCMPFGANETEYNGEKHTCHGETASAEWILVDVNEEAEKITVIFTMNTKVRPGKVTKKITLVNGQNVIYSSHILEGYEGDMPIGHHCTLRMPQGDGTLLISTSAFDYAHTNPSLFSNPENREYQYLAADAEVKDISAVPALWKNAETIDCSILPHKKGFDDALQLLRHACDNPAWTCAVYPEENFLWFSLKDAAMLPGTVMWLSNGGRHAAPWNGENACIGLEETCSYFANGLADSVQKNMFAEKGFPTAIELRPDVPAYVNFIQGVTRIPNGYSKVSEVKFYEGAVEFVDENGMKVIAEVQHDFIETGTL